MKKILKYLLVLIILWIVSILMINLYVLNFSEGKIISDINNLEQTNVWLVFWAKVMKTWIPSDILKDRLKVAIEAYKKNKINKIIVSGDNSLEKYDEPTSMKNYLVENGVLKDDIYLDYAWFDTYDTLYRARDIFWVDNIVLFTQEFHLKRALYIWEGLGIKTIWVSTNLQIYIYDDYYNRREVLARVKAFLNVEILKSKPKFLGNKIDMSNPQKELSVK